MCGRFTLRAPASVLAEHFAVLQESLFGRRYNIAPTQPVAVVRLQPEPRQPPVGLHAVGASFPPGPTTRGSAAG